MHQIFLLIHYHPFVPQHITQIIVIRNAHIGIAGTVNALIFQHFLNLLPIRASILLLVHGSPCLQMRKHPGIHLIFMIRIDTVNIMLKNLRISL